MGRVTVGLKLFAAGLVLCLFVLVHPVFADNLASHFAEFARSCGVAAKVSSARLFSNPGKDRWKEYATAKNIPQPHSDWSEWAYVWMNPGSPSVVDVEGQGEDFSDGAYYCFDSSGGLSALRHEFRTAWGWGFVETKSFHANGKEATKSYFFAMNGQAIPRPEEADNVREAMRTKMYRKLSDMPFFSLLKSASSSSRN